MAKQPGSHRRPAEPAQRRPSRRPAGGSPPVPLTGRRRSVHRVARRHRSAAPPSAKRDWGARVRPAAHRGEIHGLQRVVLPAAKRVWGAGSAGAPQRQRREEPRRRYGAGPSAEVRGAQPFPSAPGRLPTALPSVRRRAPRLRSAAAWAALRQRPLWPDPTVGKPEWLGSFLAGLLDAEGCVAKVCRRSLGEISLTMHRREEPLLRALQRRLGGGVLFAPTPQSRRLRFTDRRLLGRVVVLTLGRCRHPRKRRRLLALLRGLARPPRRRSSTAPPPPPPPSPRERRALRRRWRRRLWRRLRGPTLRDGWLAGLWAGDGTQKFG